MTVLLSGVCRPENEVTDSSTWEPAPTPGVSGSRPARRATNFESLVLGRDAWGVDPHEETGAGSNAVSRVQLFPYFSAAGSRITSIIGVSLPFSLRVIATFVFPAAEGLKVTWSFTPPSSTVTVVRLSSQVVFGSGSP